MTQKITQKEYQLPDDMIILSTADLKGNIVDYNTAFREASGYADSELIGKPHNILRHPDMPKQAFKDFWDTIQQGRPWFGIVKNKRKNGDHYWVAANASPIIEQGKITGYLSVRYPASRNQITVAETLYANVIAGRAKFPVTKLKSSYVKPALALASLLVIIPQLVWLLWGMGNPWFAFASALFGVGILGYQSWSNSSISSVLKRGSEAISNGEFHEKINDDSEWGFMLNMIRSRVGESAARSYDALRAAQIMTTALDTASTNIMIADQNFNIIRTNQSLKKMFDKNQAKIQEVLPDFVAKDVVGSNMDVFHRDPSHQRQMVAALQNTHQTEIKLGKLVLRLTVTPIEYKHERLGYVVEWLDRTIEAHIVEDIGLVVEGMKSGLLSHRVKAEAEGAFEQIKHDINQAMDIMEDFMMDVKTISLAQSEGDLTPRLTADYKGVFFDVKQAINNSLENLNETVAMAMLSADTVTASAREVAQGSADLSQRVQQQAAAVEQSSATMEELSETIMHNAENSQEESKVEHEVEAKAKLAAEVMHKTIEAMSQIQESSHKISDIVTLIDSIAFQTNLLALNAAVEAARAGDHGRGFAVVAGEVRALAQKSAEAAKDIKDLINESVTRIDQGTKLAQDSGESISDITNSIEQVAKMSEEISQASQEQAQGIGQLKAALSQIDSVTQQNAALVEQTSAAAESLNDNAFELKQKMAFFKTRQHSVKLDKPALALMEDSEKKV
ncbi:methyl-accepting chemotaxis protein [Thiomicrospira pelophila]|uniref:methyl-accepting chemotaxis protein n=1 Tax=Thiomicrospira pelophila TaxID=934 RepID=UPI0004A71134|nr:methyl-accepting chemotaxis protein [Thiomicrospira pelophila]